ncbi:hypothetical protein MVEG_07726 [Podila verticillata NRRL 6337]|nr:hypothetical protein MVEG_07726 [Podila verticillata NRRL 6337]
MATQSSIHSSSSSTAQTKKSPQLRNVASTRPVQGLSRPKALDNLMPLSRSPWTNTPSIIKNRD